jgi:hypothetical protein
MKILTEGANASSFYSKKEAVSPTNENKKLLMPEKSETNDLKMMGDLAGSDKRYSFRTNSEGNDLHVFESPIDLLSYMTLMNLKTGIWLAEPMLSLGGVYKPSDDPSKRKVPVALQNMLENHPEVTTIHLHLDNDTAGRAAACNIEDQLKNRYNVRFEFPPRGKDCNDYLMYMRKQKLS